MDIENQELELISIENDIKLMEKVIGFTVDDFLEKDDLSIEEDLFLQLSDLLDKKTKILENMAYHMIDSFEDVTDALKIEAILIKNSTVPNLNEFRDLSEVIKDRTEFLADVVKEIEE